MDHAIDVLAYVLSDDLAHTLQGFGAENPTARLRTKIADPSTLDLSRFGPTGPDILFVEVDLNDQAHIEALGPIVQKIVHRTPVFVSAASAPVDSVRHLYRLGITDFIPQPISKADFLGALEDVRPRILEARRGGREREGRTVGVIRSCGGVGGTTLGIQLADTLCELCGRPGRGGPRVSLMDLDLQYGNVALALDLQPESNLVEILSAPDRFDDTFLQSSMTPHQSGVDVLACPKSILPLDALTAEIAVDLISTAKHHYDFSVIDLPHAWANWTSAVLAAMDMVVLVTELTVTSITRARNLLDLFEELELSGLPMTIVANKVREGSGAAERLKGAEAALGRRIDYCVRADARTADEARDRGVMLREVSAKSPILADMSLVGENILQQLMPEAVQPRPQKKPSKLQLGFGKKRRA
ncbi:MAG: CpaE family protein [Alphaproteobacteria bacterium]